MIKCYLDQEPKAYITSMRILSAVTLPVDLFGVYCIVTKSPPVMKEYSRLLLIYQILATLTDTWTNMLFIPVAFLPFPIAYHVGVVLPRVHMNYGYMQIVWLCLIVTTMGAVVQLFGFRWQSLLMKDHPLRLRRKVIMAVVFTNFLLFNAAIIGAGFTMPDRTNEIKPLYAKKYTCVADIDKMQGVLYFDLADIRRLYLISSAEGALVVVVTFVLVYLTFRSFQHTNVSEKTVELQKRYLISLILQMITPIFIVIIPGCTTMLIEAWAETIFEDAYTLRLQVLTNFVICIISAHGLIGTIIMVLANEPYRRFALLCLRRCLHICLCMKQSPLRRISMGKVQDIPLPTLPTTE